MNKGQLLNQLKKIGCIKRVSDDKAFLLKSGERSTLYVDLRKMITHPNILRRTAELMYAEALPFLSQNDVDFFAGVVAGGIPLSVMLSQRSGMPMLMIRSERKTHGTGNLIEGLPDGNKMINVVLVEDVITTGISVRETLQKIADSGLKNIKVVGCVCAINRGSASDFVPDTTIPLISLWTLADLSKRTFSQRAMLAKNEFAARLFTQMALRRSNLIWSADIENGKTLLETLEKIAPYIAAVKIHFNAIDNSFDRDMFLKICKMYELLIISDHKFADIGASVASQLTHAPNETLADATTVHPIAGSGAIHALADLGISSIIVAQMSSTNSLTLGSSLAGENEKNVGAIVCQIRWDDNIDAGDGFVYMTPGVHLNRTTDGLDQNYRDCVAAIERDGCDAIIVGRGISEAPDVVEAAKSYQTAAWDATHYS